MDTDLIIRFKIAVIGVAVAIMVLLIGWFFRFFTYPNEKCEEECKIPFLAVFMGFAIFIGIAIIITPFLLSAWSYFWYGDIPDKETLLHHRGWASVLDIVLTFICLLYYTSKLPKRWRDGILGSHFNDMSFCRRNFRLGMATWLLCIPSVIAVDLLIGATLNYFVGDEYIEQVAVQQLRRSLTDTPLLVMFAINVVVLVPVVEEILFRGMLQSWIKRHWGRNISIGLTSIIFVPFHFSEAQGISNMQILGDLMVLSLFLSFLKERQHSLVAPIVLHSTFNLMSVLRIMS